MQDGMTLAVPDFKPSKVVVVVVVGLVLVVVVVVAEG